MNTALRLRPSEEADKCDDETEQAEASRIILDAKQTDPSGKRSKKHQSRAHQKATVEERPETSLRSKNINRKGRKNQLFLSTESTNTDENFMRSHPFLLFSSFFLFFSFPLLD
ncbi:unnamed protein product [Rhodiola kirilowii]